MTILDDMPDDAETSVFINFAEAPEDDKERAAWMGWSIGAIAAGSGLDFIEQERLVTLAGSDEVAAWSNLTTALSDRGAFVYDSDQYFALYDEDPR